MRQLRGPQLQRGDASLLHPREPRRPCRSGQPCGARHSGHLQSRQLLWKNRTSGEGLGQGEDFARAAAQGKHQGGFVRTRAHQRRASGSTVPDQGGGMGAPARHARPQAARLVQRFCSASESSAARQHLCKELHPREFPPQVPGLCGVGARAREQAQPRKKRERGLRNHAAWQQRRHLPHSRGGGREARSAARDGFRGRLWVHRDPVPHRAHQAAHRAPLRLRDDHPEGVCGQRRDGPQRPGGRVACSGGQGGGDDYKGQGGVHRPRQGGPTASDSPQG
mmetsp:Transcript_47082/g.89908  ORF Transcript_47082/g.89908 Transcript_47082/m.89908 type:complete len:279 (+) Transcript_47082:274-1110(+)